MKWRAVLELVGADGTVGVHEISGAAAVAEYAPQMIGLTLTEGKQMLAAVQRHLVRPRPIRRAAAPRQLYRWPDGLRKASRGPRTEWLRQSNKESLPPGRSDIG
jgi:hypothetical protein